LHGGVTDRRGGIVQRCLDDRSRSLILRIAQPQDCFVAHLVIRISGGSEEQRHDLGCVDLSQHLDETSPRRGSFAAVSRLEDRDDRRAERRQAVDGWLTFE
jgi:hypothetical protein